jgi:hypothetical protein
VHGQSLAEWKCPRPQSHTKTGYESNFGGANTELVSRHRSLRRFSLNEDKRFFNPDPLNIK